jgi:ABC-type transport system substrate-binding protein
MRSRRRVLTALVAVGATILVGCSGPAAKPADGDAAGGTVVHGKTDGGTTFVRNYNVLGPATDKAPNMELVYEPLMRVDYGDGGVVKPWLAESWRFAEAGKAPFSPIYNNCYFVEINATRWTGRPTPDGFDHIPFVGMGPDTILTLLGLQRRGS